MSNYDTTTIRGQFDHYANETYDYNNGDFGKKLTVIFKNCKDLKTGVIYPEVKFNLTKGFQAFGVITDQPILDITCRRRTDETPSTDNNFGYYFPTNISTVTDYQQFTGDYDSDLALIKRQGAAFQSMTEN